LPDIGESRRIDGGDAYRAGSNETPFGGLMPVQLTNGAGSEPHVDAGNLLRDLEIGLGDLSRPAAVLNASRGIVERRPEHRHVTDIGRRRRDGIGKLR
jgi:hypothetical protein